MKFRFVYLTPSGEQAEIESVQELRAAVLSGEVGAETLLHDMLTHEWAPARLHPVFELIRDSVDTADTADSVDPAPRGLELDLTLAEAPDGVDPEARFWEDQERAAQEAQLAGEVAPAPGLRAFDPGRAVTPLEPPAPDPAHPAGASAPATPAGGPIAEPATPAEAPIPEPAEARIPAPAPELLHPLDIPAWRPIAWVREADSPVAQALRSPIPHRQATLLIVLSAIGGWGIADAWAGPPPADEVVRIAENARVTTAFTKGHPEVLSGAFDDMLRGMDALRGRMGLDAPPESWLSDAYLADAAAFPEVESHWDRYGLLVDSLRARDEDLFRSGFVARLQHKGIVGAVLSIELARALREFDDDAPRRERLYDAMQELSEASLALHARLLYGGPSSEELDRVTEALARVGGEDPREAGRLERTALAEG